VYVLPCLSTPKVCDAALNTPDIVVKIAIIPAIAPTIGNIHLTKGNSIWYKPN
jgi:hypothetical protein